MPPSFLGLGKDYTMDAYLAERADLEVADEHAAILKGTDAYAKYYSAQDLAFRLQMECLKVRGVTQQTETYEATMLQDMLQRLRYTTSVLRMKYAFPNTMDSRGNLRVDVTGSGFPFHHYITSLDVDLMDKDAILQDLPTAQSLDKAILRHMLENGEEPISLLATRAKRAYLEMLDPQKLFLPFTMGPVMPWNGKGLVDQRRYVGGWGCYDRERNIPFLHYMVFDQDKSERPLEEHGDNFAKFLRAVRLEGSLAPEKLKSLGDALDNAIDPIHPKLIKRVRVGPFYSPLLINERPEADRSEVESTILDILRRADCEDGFVLFFNEEILPSVGQKEERGFFSRVVREVFIVPPFDESAQEVGATRVHRYIIAPHRAFQVLRTEDKAKLPRFNERIKFGYDEKERIYEIG